jgi:hypothetical protein
METMIMKNTEWLVAIWSGTSGRYNLITMQSYAYLYSTDHHNITFYKTLSSPDYSSTTQLCH